METQNIATQIIVNGINSGLIYILAALGFTLIFSILSVFNFAHGEFYMLGAILVYYFAQSADLPYAAALVLAVISTGLLGFIVEKYLFRRLYGQMYPSFMVAIGLSLAISTTVALIFGVKVRFVAVQFPGVVRFLGTTLAWQNIAVILESAVLVLLLYLLINKTKFGLATRATADSRLAASLVGVNVRRLGAWIFALSTALAGIAGALVAPLYFVTPYIGQPVIFKAMVVVILGGLGSVPGAIVGGLVLGFIDSVATSYLGGIATVLGWFVVLVLVLLRPQGLLGKARPR